MAYLDTNHQRAAFLVLGAALVFALAPFATGLLGIPVLYVIFQPVQDSLARRVGPRTAAALVVPLATLVGALAGIPYFGILGLLIGPLALSYFFELSGLYREEYLEEPAPTS